MNESRSCYAMYAGWTGLRGTRNLNIVAYARSDKKEAPVKGS